MLNRKLTSVSGSKRLVPNRRARERKVLNMTAPVSASWNPRVAGVLGWVLMISIGLVLLAIMAVNLYDTLVIQRAAAQDRLDAFVRAAKAVSRIVGDGNITTRDSVRLKEQFGDL